MATYKVDMTDKELVILQSGLKALHRSLTVQKGRTASVLIEQAIDKELVDCVLASKHLAEVK